jgi:trehalose 6-phosphate synthase
MGEPVTDRPPAGTEREIIVASNRGPVSFVREEGRLVARRGPGGLVTALTGALQASGGLWIASAMTDEDRERARTGLNEGPIEGTTYSLRLLDLDPGTYEAFYNGISNRVLWFLHHYLWDVTTTPRFDDSSREAWRAYQAVNGRFAAAMSEEGGRLGSPPAYLVQDYHLSLVPALLRELRPDGAIAHFMHIPYPGPIYLRILPRFMWEELLRGLLGADLVGFHAARWADNFLLACRELEDAQVDLRRRIVRWNGHATRVGIFPLSIDADALRETAGSRETAEARTWIEEWRGETKLIVRVDRAELSKNILRGFAAYEEMLARYPNWQGKVKFLALLTPSREGIPEYRDYMKECSAAVDRVNERFERPGWRPVEMLVKDDYPLSIAAYQLYDVLLVNPVLDGLNLVAKEGPVLNEHAGVLVLSENAGAYAELGGQALRVNPFDLTETADALAAGLGMDAFARARRARGLRRAVARNRLDRWVPKQLEELDRFRSGRPERRGPPTRTTTRSRYRERP